MANWFPLFAPSGPQFPSPFLGNPDANITALDVTGSIPSYWDGAQTTPRIPAFYHVSASEMLGTGTSRPFEDLHFAWNFGDSGSAETFIRPTDGVTVNSNSGQVSPEAVHCYRIAGSYIITLTVAGAGGNVVTTKTKNITIGAFTASTTYWLDSNASGANNGTSSTDAWTAMSSLTAALNSGSTQTFSNIKINIAKGSSYTTGLLFNNSGLNSYSGIRIETYGSGAKPVISPTTSHGINVTMQTSAACFFYDMVVSGLNITINNTAGFSCIAIGTGGRTPATDINLIENIYGDNCDFTQTSNNNTGGMGIIYAGSLTYRAIKANGWWNCNITHPDISLTTCEGISGSSMDWFFVVGGQITGSSTSNFDHHIYPDCFTHEYYSWIKFGKPGVTSGRGYCLNLNWDIEFGDVVIPTTLTKRWTIVSECETQQTSNGGAVDAGNRQNNINQSPDNVTYFTEFVIQRNAMHNNHSNTLMQLPCAKEVTVRGNRAWANDGATFLGPPNTAFYVGATTTSGQWAMAVYKVKSYENKVHVQNGVYDDAIFGFKDSTWTPAQQWSRNVIRDFRTSTTNGCIFAMYYSALTAAANTITRNQILSTVSARTVIDGTAGDQTYAAFTGAGYNVGGSNTDPGWSATVTQWSDLN